MPQPQQRQCRIQAVSVTYPMAHGNAGSPTHWARPGIEPISPWLLVRLVFAVSYSNYTFSFIRNCQLFSKVFIWFYVTFRNVWKLQFSTSLLTLGTINHWNFSHSGKFISHFVFLFVCFLGLHPWHMEVPRLGVQLELQLLAYATATATSELSLICDLHHSW